MGFIGGSKPWGRERVSGLIICDHQMEQVDMPRKLNNWKFLSCFASGETIRQGETSGHKSGGLVSVLASGPSTCPKKARDLTISRKLILLLKFNVDSMIHFYSFLKVFLLCYRNLMFYIFN
jgi:hypothetical protein